MDETINLAVIGCGYWGPNLIRNFSTTPGVRLAAVCDLNAERLLKLHPQFPGLETTTDYAALLARADIHAVAIATPVSSHFALAKQALAAGKHVMVEKPITATVAQAEELIALAQKNGLVLMVDHTFAYTSAVRKIKELISSGQLGQMLYYDSVRINLGLFQHDVNVLWDLAVHDLAIMDFALGLEPSAVSATGIAHLAGQPENVAYLTCFFENNLIAHFHLNWLSPLKIRRTIIGGDRKMLVYDDLEPSEKLKIYDRGASLNDVSAETLHRTLVDYRMGDMWSPHLDQTEALKVESAHFVECITQGKTPITDGHAGLRVVRILEAANKSLAQRGMPVNLK